MSRNKRRSHSRRSSSQGRPLPPRPPATTTLLPASDVPHSAGVEGDTLPQPSAAGQDASDEMQNELAYGGEYPPAMLLLAGDYPGPVATQLQQGLEQQGLGPVEIDADIPCAYSGFPARPMVNRYRMRSIAPIAAAKTRP